MNARGMTIVETLVGLAVVAIASISIAAVFSNYWATSGKLKKESQSSDMAVMIMSDVFDSPWIKITKLCDSKNIWKETKVSECKSIDLLSPKFDVLKISSQKSNLPLYSSLLGKNLAGFATTGSVNPSCVDLIRCKNVLSNGLVELTFAYHFLSAKGTDVQEKHIMLRRGTW